MMLGSSSNEAFPTLCSGHFVRPSILLSHQLILNVRHNLHVTHALFSDLDVFLRNGDDGWFEG